MHRLSVFSASLLAAFCALPSSPLAAATPAAERPAVFTSIPRVLAVTRDLGPPPAGVAELKFRDVFRLPVGPKGLEATERLRSLDGKRVRIVGYLVAEENPTAGSFLLSPLPVASGDEDESLADDLPASTLLVRLPTAPQARVPYLPGLIQVTGTLHVGGYEAPGSARIAPARIDLDAAPERALLRLAKDRSETRHVHR